MWAAAREVWQEQRVRHAEEYIRYQTTCFEAGRTPVPSEIPPTWRVAAELHFGTRAVGLLDTVAGDVRLIREVGMVLTGVTGHRDSVGGPRSDACCRQCKPRPPWHSHHSRRGLQGLPPLAPEDWWASRDPRRLDVFHGEVTVLHGWLNLEKRGFSARNRHNMWPFFGDQTSYR